MNIKCKIFGHKWNDGKFKQSCKRKNCKVERTLMEYPHRGKYGQSEFDWQIIDFEKFKLR